MIIGIGIYFLTNEKIEILGAVIATGISLSLGIRQYKTENDKILKELFIEFNTKYDFQGNEKLIVDYLNSCTEEYLWKTKDRIPKEVWQSWKNAPITTNCPERPAHIGPCFNYSISVDAKYKLWFLLEK